MAMARGPAAPPMTETSGPTSTTTTLIYTRIATARDPSGRGSDGSAAHYNIVVVKHATEVDYLGLTQESSQPGPHGNNLHIGGCKSTSVQRLHVPFPDTLEGGS